MPAAAMAERPKRKREVTKEVPTKRRKSLSEDEDMDEGSDAGEDIMAMEASVLESRKNYNDISTLLSYMDEFSDGSQKAMLAAVALCRVFIQLLAQDAFRSKKGISEKDAVVVAWLKDQLEKYKGKLIALLLEEDVALTVLTLSMRLLKAEGESQHYKEDYSFPKAFFQDIVGAVLECEDDDVRKAFVEDFAEQNDDIRYFTFNTIKAIVEGLDEDDEEVAQVFDSAFMILSALDGVPESAEELEDFYIPQPKKKTHALLSVHQHKKQAQGAWLALISLSGTKDRRKRILDVISKVIAPWFTKPELLSDFLTNSYNMGGSTSLLALSGVFYLIRERNLDYPSFYPKLYSLLDRDILHSKHRSRFFRLLDTFLGSTHLPAALVASFIKRLSRLALNAPPGAIVCITPWIYNLLKRHPTCALMLHRETRDPEAKKHLEEHGAEDPFLADETDPIQAQAIDSCLWELIQLQSHYHPNVATITKIISEQFTKHSYNIEDFLDHSYASLLEAEVAKDVKKAPVVEFHIPKKVFMPQDLPAAEPDSLIVKLWDFGGAVTEVA